MPKILRTPRRAVEQARQDRAKLELPEVLLWQQLRKRPCGFKFRRQNPQLGYRIDFACLEARLAIEVDGEAHERGDRPERDARRDHRLEQRGFATLRIPANEILRDLDAVLAHIVRACRARLPLHPRPSAGGPPPRSGEEFQG
ncbi:endonuclease domain-containing protein [Sphingomonas sp. RS6]